MTPLVALQIKRANFVGRLVRVRTEAHLADMQFQHISQAEITDKAKEGDDALGRHPPL